ncbi:MAG: ribonuclease HII [Candidatus Heimdallarchaeota archaeon]
MSKIVVGADEAGRGLIIGPMVIGASAIDNSIADNFRQLGIKDSKKYTSVRKIDEHANAIKKTSFAWSVKVLSAEVLNNFNKNGMTMDEAEAFAFFRAIEEIVKKVKGVQEYQVDNFQAVARLKSLLKKNNSTRHIKLIVMPKAESKYIAVSAGSILARSKSLHELSNIRNKYGNFGSGSTNDIKTINWLKQYYRENQKWPSKIVRTHWKTIDRLEREIKF